MVLDDVLAPDLEVVFCGSAVGAKSAERRAYYAGPGNAFWPTLHEVGLTPVRLEPGEYRRVLEFGIGLTDVCKVKAGADAEIRAAAFDTDRLLASLDAFRPRVVAFNGKKAGSVALGRPVAYGHQPELVGPSIAFVLPSTSGAARRYWDVEHWHALARALG